MAATVNARISPRIEQKLAEHCAKRGVTRTQALVRALDRYLDEESDGASPYSLAADLIPAKGVKVLQSGCQRKSKIDTPLCGDDPRSEACSAEPGVARTGRQTHPMTS